MPRRTWIAGKVDSLVSELAAAGMHLDRERAAEVINDRVSTVAAVMRVTEPTARRYLDDDTVKEIARQMLFELVAEQPGADLLDLPRTVPLPLFLTGRVLAGLAEAMQIRAANESAEQLRDVIATYGQTISAMSQMIAGADVQPADGTVEILFPPALLRRAARYLRVAGDRARDGRLPEGVSEADRPALVAALRRDADGLATLTDNA